MAIRPRPAWQACDLGVLLAQRHAGRLMLSWAAITLPIHALLTVLLWNHPGWALFLFWWMKPLYERLPLLILSRGLFGEHLTLRQSLAAWPGLLRQQTLASLTWRRLSPVRSFALPVQQLEGLGGQARRERLAVLLQRDANPARWLTIVGAHLEGTLWLGLVGLLLLLVPQQIEWAWEWQDVLGLSAEWLWLEHVSNTLYVLILIVWGPVYVACGFSLYLNRRTWLEAWDIELSFRRMRDRLSGLAGSALLGVLLVTLGATAPPAAFAEPAADLTRAQAREAVTAVLDAPPFQNEQSVTRWRFSEAADEAADDWNLADLLDGLEQLDSLRAALAHLALPFEMLLWAALVMLLVWLGWRYRAWLHLAGRRLSRSNTLADTVPRQLFGLDLAPETLPTDPAAEAYRLWQSQPREALRLLYRALLSHLVHRHGLRLRASDTEAQVLQRVETLGAPTLQRFANELTQVWQAQAYGHRPPTLEERERICTGWADAVEGRQ